MADDLLPCPFCGGTEIHIDDNGYEEWLQCVGCNAAGPYTEDDAEAGVSLKEAWNRRSVPPSVRDFLGKMQGVCMGVAMSGRDHPNPDGALMELFNEAQAILFPPVAVKSNGDDHG